jgi:hypothetical protein
VAAWSSREEDFPCDPTPEGQPSTVIEFLALLVALGGTSYAVIRVPANSVGTRQLKKGAVTPPKLSASTVARLKGATGPKRAQG